MLYKLCLCVDCATCNRQPQVIDGATLRFVIFKGKRVIRLNVLAMSEKV